MRRVLILVCLLLPVFLWVGCTKRKNPADPPVPPRGSVLTTAPNFVGTLDAPNNALFFNNIRPEPSFRTVRVYTPPGYKTRGQGRPFPTLYLLHDFGANDTYFGFFEFAQLLDQMIADGEIQPMIVVQTDASNFYGGSFYTNSTSTARYFTMIDSALVRYVDSTYNTVFGRRSRAISGHGMGGYGALKLALTGNDSTFGSVSALSAPLAFAGSGGSQGFRSPSFIDAVFSEAGISKGNFAEYRNDSLLKPDPADPTRYRTSMLFGLAAAFSPADTIYRGKRDSILTAINSGTSPDSNYFQFSKTPRDAGLLFPIDVNGNIIDSVWRRWLGHSIDSLIKIGAFVGRLDSTPLFLSCGTNDQFGMLAQNRGFESALQTAGRSRAANFIGMVRNQYYYEEYPGYPGKPADHHTFINDQLVKILKFHSQFLDTAMVP